MSSILTNYLEKLRQHWKVLSGEPLQKLFSNDPKRFEKMSVRLGDLIFDYSKNHIDSAALDSLLALADESNLGPLRDRMFAGEIINTTENRAVLHTALRNLSGESVNFEGIDVMPEILEVRMRMADFCDAVRAGEYLVSGKPVSDVVNIGIGGSDLGPKMVAEALSPYCDGPQIHFVSNVDPADIMGTLRLLDPKTTLVVVVSKTFTTRETMANAKLAKAWIEGAGVSDPGSHFCAVSTNLVKTTEFGIPQERTFGFWDWVGGRYSVWSAVGLSVMLALGPDAFEDFLAGAHLADDHFKNEAFEDNIPVLMALVSIWNRNVCGFSAQAILPYDNRMASFPRWLQQLAMESNGKSVSVSGERVSFDTSPVLFGEPGTNGQHAFYQMLHQGTTIVPSDFLVAAQGHEREQDKEHRILVANCLAQSEALMRGRTLEEAGSNPHKVFEGNRPSNSFLYRKLDPKTLGLLMALYEHKTFVEGAIWGINSFDQFGVELGKELAGDIENLIENSGQDHGHGGSTTGLLGVLSAFRNSES